MSTPPLQVTVLGSRHRELGARMGAFAGWEMPIRYPAGTLAEHTHTRTRASLFDVSHMGEFRVCGPGAAAALDRLVPRRVVDQPVGVCRYTFLLNHDGGVLDDLIVYRLEPEVYLLVVNAGTAASDLAWIREATAGADVHIADQSAATAKLDLQGPGTLAVLAELGLAQDAVPRYFRCCCCDVLGTPIVLSRTGYTGEAGVELYVPAAAAGAFWDRLLAHPEVAPAGLGARDTLRLEMGYPLYGHELHDQVTPIEAGFERFLDLDGREFVGREALVRPPRQRLRGFRLAGRRAARAGDRIWRDGHDVGTVTSGAFAPSLGYAVAMGYVRADVAADAGSWELGSPGRSRCPAEPAAMPFYSDGTARQ